jgi:hypothetical protein
MSYKRGQINETEKSYCFNYTTDKSLTAPASAQEANSKPCNGFEKVVGARDKVESIAIGNGTRAGASRAKVA